MGLFSRKKKDPKDVNITINYQQTTPEGPQQSQLPACRECYSSQRTQLAITQSGPNTGRKYYVCIGCPAPGRSGRSWIVWADQITV